MKSRAALRVLLVLAAAAALITAAVTVEGRRKAEEAAVDDIEARLGELDPATRAAVVAKLAKDAGDSARAH